MNNFLNKFFSFSAKEKKGILVLLALIGIAFYIPKVLKQNQQQSVWDFNVFQKQIDNFIAGQVVEEPIVLNEESYLSEFDPNTSSHQELIRLGFTKKQASTIVNFRESGGHFNKPIDLLKVYGLNKADYRRVKSYINIKDKNVCKAIVFKQEQTKTVSVSENKLRLNLNEIDSVALLSVKGIGKVFAKRIVNYRNYLGGFYSVNQLSEVYGFNQELLRKVKPFLYVDSSQIVVLDLNKSKFNEFNKHPYISYTDTKAIFKYRNVMGKFSSASELLENNLIDSLTFYKIRPYLSVN